MFQQIITPSASNHAVLLPEAYYGKKMMVTAFELNDKKEKSKKNLTKTEEVRAFFNSFQIDLRGFIFNREEANER